MKHGRGVKTEWYGPTEGTLFSVRYKYNMLEMKRQAGATSRNAGEEGATQPEVLDRLIGRDASTRGVTSPCAGSPLAARGRRTGGACTPAGQSQEASGTPTKLKLDLTSVNTDGTLPLSPPVPRAARSLPRPASQLPSSVFLPHAAPLFHPHDLTRTHTDAGIATIFSNRQQPRHE